LRQAYDYWQDQPGNYKSPAITNQVNLIYNDLTHKQTEVRLVVDESNDDKLRACYLLTIPHSFAKGECQQITCSLASLFTS